MLFAVFVRRHNHQHIPAFDIGTLLDDAVVLQGLFDSAKAVAADVLVSDLTAAETNAEFDLFALAQPFGGPLDVELKVIFVRFGAQLDLLDGDLDLILLGFALLAALFILEFAVIHDAADRRFGIWRHFNQIQPNIVSPLLGITDIHHTYIGIGVINKPNFAGAAYISIDSMR